MSLPTWAPDRPRVASYIPGRTLAVDSTSDAQRGTFDTTTRPTGAQVDQIITDACSWVTIVTGDIAAAYADQATAVAAIRAAGMVELAYPDTNSDLNTADRLLAEAAAMRTSLDLANRSATGVDPDTPVLLPTGSFPPAPPWGDLYL